MKKYHKHKRRIKMKKNRKNHYNFNNHVFLLRFSLLFFLGFVSMINLSFSLGITPPSFMREYSPGKTEELSLTVIGDLNNKREIITSLDGNLKEYINFNETTFVLNPGERKTINFKLNHPEYEELSEYGKVCSYIHVTEKSPEDSRGISAVVEMKAKVCIDVPYPGKYLEVGLSPRNVNENIENTVVIVDLTSKGREVIEKVTGTLFIMKDEKIINQYSFNKELIIPSTKETIPLTISTKDLQRGEYTINAKINYDGNTAESEAKLIIGYPDVEILKHSEILEAGAGDNFEIYVENKYFSEFNMVYAEVIIDNNENFKYSTAPIKLSPGSKEILKTFVGTKGLSVGEHDVTINLYFGENVKTYQGKILISEKNENIQQQKPVNPKRIYLVILFIVLINVTIIIAIILIMRKQKIEEGEL